MPIEALTSEKKFEDWREDVGDYGKLNDWRFYSACLWLRDNGLKALCGDPPAFPNPDLAPKP